ncbi:DUF2795 domain-containing protein [Microbacterium resistens]|uniref:DUF2795 domain-containing protein n=1 Tax=Microbacterium resistens TaxID=156977 RepID=A0ABY3RPL3_9MICO|nr:DUF2795 domain-containing protein [Microbacterium resistens]UGS25806.1 DUF2795 domain-containing protein [Microbacterium resistens]
MMLSPSLNRFLAEMEYPAEKDDLVREARREDLPMTDLLVVQGLPERSYDSWWQIRRAIGEGSDGVPAERELVGA